MALGMNTKDLTLLDSVTFTIAAARTAETQHTAMTQILWAKHLLETLLRQMQDD